MWKPFALSVFACAVTMVVTNGVMYVAFYGDFLANNSGLPRELFERVQKPAAETEVLPTILSMLFAGGLLTYVVHLNKAKTFVAGARTAFLFGCLMLGAVNLGLLATTYYYSHLSAIVDIFVAAITFAAAGGVAAVILNRGAASAR